MRSSPASLCGPLESSTSSPLLPHVDVRRLPSADSSLLSSELESAQNPPTLSCAQTNPIRYQTSGRTPTTSNQPGVRPPVDLLLSQGRIEPGQGGPSASLPPAPGSQQERCQYPELLAASCLNASYTHCPAAQARTINLQARYCSLLASTAGKSPLQGHPRSEHSQQLQSIMGQVMPLLAMFMESIPEQFIASQSISLLDGTSRMSATAFDSVKATALSMGLSIHQLDLIRALDDKYLQKVTGLCINREASLAALQMTTPAQILSPLGSPHKASSVAADMTQCSASFALQQEAYLHLIRTFALTILTPYQCSLLCFLLTIFIPEQRYVWLPGHS
ncbi:hypothetical protein WJX84_007523 [Apatococcus fuscideae]|uniref:Uncharacterized protein n=1 Tax=Apatococcus fuscideae TaxID=2026836 RepID=A0AAW1SWB1_9CHLO